MSPDQRSSLFREVNDRIYDLLEAADPDLPGEFLCECGQDCGERVELLPAAFAPTRGVATVKSTCVSAPSSSTTSTFASMRGNDGSANAASSNASGRIPAITWPSGSVSVAGSGIA